MPYWELYCHLVWTTRARAPLLIGERAGLAEGAIRMATRGQGAVIHAVGIMPDHVRVAVSVPPRLAVADLAKAIKGSGSHLLNHAPGRTFEDSFAWQAEYGALSFGKRSLASVVAYVCNQRAHHAGNDLWPTFERTGRPYQLSSNEGS